MSADLRDAGEFPAMPQPDQLVIGVPGAGNNSHVRSDILSRLSSFSYFQFLAEQDMPPPPQLLRPTPLLRAATSATTGTQVRKLDI